MVKEFVSLMTPRAKHGKTAMHSWWWPVPLKMPVLVIDKSSVVTSRFYRLKKTENVLGAIFFLHFF